MIVSKDIDLIVGVGKNSNIYIVDGEVMIDTGIGNTFTETKNYIMHKYSLGINKIINTSCYANHSGGSIKFRNWLGAKVFIHENDMDSLETGEGTCEELFDVKLHHITTTPMKNGTKIVTSKRELEVIHTPGYSPGSICLYDPDKKILFSGGLLTDNGIGPLYDEYSKIDDIKKSLRKLLNYEIKILLPAFGPPKVGIMNFHIKQQLLALRDKDER